MDFDQRDEDKTSANILILGNSGQGKSYLMKLLILNLLESGKSVITLDAEHEQQEMCEAVGGCFADLMAGKYIINVLEPKCWDDGGDPDDTAAPEAFRKSTLLAQHVSFLKDFFRAYKDFSDAHIDTIEIKLLTVGNTVAALDELYIWLSNPTAIEYIRNCLKRVRKKESAMLLASQNLEDFDQEQVREMTKPLFSIPPHQFLFNAGSIDKRSYMEMLQLDEAEYNLIKFPQRGVCLYKCGNERYLLEVHAPTYKEKLFGTAGGR